MTRSVPRRTSVVANVWTVALVEPSGRRDAGDDVVGAADAEALATLVEKQRRVGLGGGPVGAFVEPAGDGDAELGVDWDVADAFAFAEDPQDALAGGAGDVVDVERDDLANPGAGVERDER